MHQTKNLDDGYFGSGKLIQRAVKKHGIDNFHKEILYIFDSEEKMKLAEKILVVVDTEISYNLLAGGMGGFGYINKNVLCGEKRKIHNTRVSGFKNIEKNKIKENARRAGQICFFLKKGMFKDNFINSGFKNKSHTKEWKENQSNIMKEKQKGSKNSQFGTIWITNSQENKKIKKELLDIWIEKGYYKGRI